MDKEPAIGTIPVLETARLTLRPHRPSDTEPMIRAFADDGFSRFITSQKRGLSREEAWKAIAQVAGSWALMGFGPWVVEERASGAPVGRIGPYQAEGWPGFEIGWSIFPQFQGKGYAIEGAAAAIAWAHIALGRTRVIHLIHPLNTASQRVALALGAEFTSEWEWPSSDRTHIWTTSWESFTSSRSQVSQQVPGVGR